MTKRIKIFLIAFVLSLPFWWGVNVFQENLTNCFYAQISQPFDSIVKIKIPKKPKKPDLILQAKSAISVLRDSRGRERILFQKESSQLLPIASLTKLMTAITVLKNQTNYDLAKTWVTISKEAEAQDKVPNYGNLKAGEQFNVQELLNLMLIYSSNDAAWALSEMIGTDNFVAQMNQTAQEVGLKDTYFVNPTGLDPEEITYETTAQDHFNHSTAEDLVKLSQYVLKEYPSIFETSLKEGPYPVQNGISDLELPGNQKIIGKKTGYTEEAGGCLLLVLEDNKGNEFINIVLGTPSLKSRIGEMQKLIDWLAL